MEKITDFFGVEKTKVNSFAFWHDVEEESKSVIIHAEWVGDSRFDGQIDFDYEYYGKCGDEKDEYLITDVHIMSDCGVRDQAWLFNAVIPELEKYADKCGFVLNV